MKRNRAKGRRRRMVARPKFGIPPTHYRNGAWFSYHTRVKGTADLDMKKYLFDLLNIPYRESGNKWEDEEYYFL